MSKLQHIASEEAEPASPMSFHERSVWIQLVAVAVSFVAYLAVAAIMWSRGVTELLAYMIVFLVSVVAMVVVLVVGHTAAALLREPEVFDERDRVISWRAESNSSWVIAAGVITAIGCMMMSIDQLWTAHLLLISLYLSQILAFVLQLVYYRRGIASSVS